MGVTCFAQKFMGFVLGNRRTSEREPWVMRVSYMFLKYTVGVIVKFLWVGKVTGLENIPPKGAVIIAANHESWLDIACMVAICPRQIRFLAGEKLFGNVFSRTLMKLTGQFEVDRRLKDKSKLRSDVATALSKGQVVGIFPEGTRTRDGKMLRAFTGVAQFALKHHVPILPVGLNGAYEAMSAHDKFPKFGKKVDMTIGELFWLNDFYNQEQSRELFQNLTDDTMVKIAQLVDKEYLHICADFD